MHRLAAVALIILVASGCGGSAPNAPQTAPTASSAITTTSPAPTRPTSAGAMIRALKHVGAPISGIVVFTARTDSNHLLGRPSGYKSKGAWRDPRISASDTVGFTLGDIDVGGGIEVFQTEEGAIARGGYIQSIGAPIANEYDYACGRALLRISGYLTPKQARQYKRALAEVLGTSCSTVT